MRDAEDVTESGMAPEGAGPAALPLTTRLSLEIPKPKDWQAFQRNCVVLYREELKDPHAQEYGRNGQDQSGIDIIGRRNGNPDHQVGIQCRLYQRPLKKDEILKDARKALALEVKLKELIFVTTAPNDTGATLAANEIERLLRGEGYDIQIAVYGWGQLETVIAVHPVAYAAFHPSAMSTSASRNPSLSTHDLADIIATHVAERIRGDGLAILSSDTSNHGLASEDPLLHVKIDTYRDLLKDQRHTLSAQQGLLKILETEDLSAKPWARFRIETNLAAIDLDLGKSDQAALRFEAAHTMRPTDPNAIANLALARALQGRFEEAMQAAHAALEGSPRADHAVGYLLQAAARSDWSGDPLGLIPEDLRGTLHADIGLAEFLGRRQMPGWAAQTCQMAKRHPDSLEFKRANALAVLSLALDSEDAAPRQTDSISGMDVAQAADDMKSFAEHCLEVGYSNRHDLHAHLHNAALLLRLCNRHAECEALLLRGRAALGIEGRLTWLLALAQLALGRADDAAETVAGETDPESVLLRAELRAANRNISGALAEVLQMETSDLSDRIRWQRWRLIGELSLLLDDRINLASAITSLRELRPNDIVANLLEIKGDRTAEGLASIRKKLQSLAASIPSDLDTASRFSLAEELRDQGLPYEAVNVLEDVVDLSRHNAGAILYLQALAAARRDDAFKDALGRAHELLRTDPLVLWAAAAHAWNIGDLIEALRCAEEMLRQVPDDPNARLLKLEIYIRQDRSRDVFVELEKPLEALAWRDPENALRAAFLLGQFGYRQRAISFAYRLFLEHRDLPRAWMTFSTLALEEGRSDQDSGRNAPTVGTDMAVDLRFDDGSSVFFVVEPDRLLRKYDEAAWEPEHPLARAAMGHVKGSRIVTSDGRGAEIVEVKHKYLARLSFVLDNYETRFPEVFGFRNLPIDTEAPGGLDEMIRELKDRRDWIQEEQGHYTNGFVPIAILAQRLGMSVIDVASGVASQGLKLKVAGGRAEERDAAWRAIVENGESGCVLDTLTFWTAWKLGSLPVMQSTCGAIHLPQSVMDELRGQRERLKDAAREGLKTVSYAEGSIALQEISADTMGKNRDEMQAAISWAEENAEIVPVLAVDDLPLPLRQIQRAASTDAFDALVVGIQRGLLLVSDDLPVREFGIAQGRGSYAWSHAVFGVALSRGFIDQDTYVRWSATLIEAGYSYIGMSGPALARAAFLDSTIGEVPGPIFRALCDMIGGKIAEPGSHIMVCIECLRLLWLDRKAIRYREAATGYLLGRLIAERVDDYREIIATISHRTQRIFSLRHYLSIWKVGHFIS